MKKTYKCVVCNDLSLKVWKAPLEKNKYSVYICDECHVGVTIPRPSDKELSILYSADMYRNKTGRRFNNVVENCIYKFRKLRVNRIKSFLNKGNLLDIGCGRGLFLHLMQNEGFTVKGIEFNKEIANYVKKTYDIDVVWGDYDKWMFNESTFDIITMFHVLEHLQQPYEMLMNCHKLLKENGLLIISVPNLYSLQGLVGKYNWLHLDIPYHLYHFTEKGLIKMLKKTQFKIIKIIRFDAEYNIFGWLQTLMNIIGFEKNFLFNILKNSDIKQSKLKLNSYIKLVILLLFLVILTPLSLILSIIESFILKKSGTIEVYAVKKG